MMTANMLTDSASTKVTNLVRDGKQAIFVGLIPILGLVFILRLAQWYLYRKQYRALAADDSSLAQDFRSALPRLWFAVLFWPVLILFFVVYIAVT